MNKQIFVYGTLKKGFSNHWLLEDQEFIGKAETTLDYVMLGQGIPYVYESDKAYRGDVGYPLELVKGSKIKGELYKVSDEALARIDQLEGHPRWYCRKQINVRVDIGNKHLSCYYSMTTKAWIYFMRTERSIGSRRHKGYPWFTAKANIVNSFDK